MSEPAAKRPRTGGLGPGDAIQGESKSSPSGAQGGSPPAARIGDGGERADRHASLALIRSTSPRSEPKLDSKLPRVIDIRQALQRFLPGELSTIVAEYDSLPVPPYAWGARASLSPDDPRRAGLKSLLESRHVPADRVEAFMSRFDGVELDPQEFADVELLGGTGFHDELQSLGFAVKAVRFEREGDVGPDPTVSRNSLVSASLRQSVEFVRFGGAVGAAPAEDWINVPGLREVHYAFDDATPIPMVLFTRHAVHAHADFNRLFPRQDHIPYVSSSDVVDAVWIECAMRETFDPPAGFMPSGWSAGDGKKAESSEFEQTRFGDEVSARLCDLDPGEARMFRIGARRLVISRDALRQGMRNPANPGEDEHVFPYLVELEWMSNGKAWRICAPMTHPAQMRGVHYRSWKLDAPGAIELLPIRAAAVLR